MRRFWGQLLLAIALLSMLAPGFAQHQMHADTGHEARVQHTHLRLLQQRVVVDDCQRYPLLFKHSSLNDQHHAPHKEIKLIALCFDCPCHGSHFSIANLPLPAAEFAASAAIDVASFYHVPVFIDDVYRPPIPSLV